MTMSNKKETILNVDGMTCSSCIRHVEAALHEIDGIDKVEVKLKDGKVRIEHDPSRSTIDEMIQALGDAGYESRAAGA
jgi:copper chaperone